MKTPFPDEVRRFILTSIPSVPYLEALLLLRSGSRESWDAARVAQRLYVRETDAAALLSALEASGIAQRADVGYTYAPNAELAARIDQVAGCYVANLVEVTELIHSRLERRAHQFADAFRFKKQGDS